jgi:ribosomal protein S28E/S33
MHTLFDGKMDSTRVNTLRGSDTTRTVVRETAISASVGAKMDSVRVNTLRGSDTTRTVVREGVISASISSKMDSVRVNSLRGSDSTRAIAREALKYGPADTVAVLGTQSDINTLRGADTARAIVREGLKLNISDTTSFKNQFTAVNTALAGKQATLVIGRVAFSTTNARVAVYIPGVTVNSNFAASGVSANGTTVPTLIMLPQVYYKTDSLVFIRGTGGPSGEVVTYIGTK